MNIEKNHRGFQTLLHDSYTDNPQPLRLVQCSSMIGQDYDDAWTSPGSSYLWIGKEHHLNRAEVTELVGYLQHWLKTGRLAD